MNLRFIKDSRVFFILPVPQRQVGPNGGNGSSALPHVITVVMMNIHDDFFGMSKRSATTTHITRTSLLLLSNRNNNNGKVIATKALLVRTNTTSHIGNTSATITPIPIRHRVQQHQPVLYVAVITTLRSRSRLHQLVIITPTWTCCKAKK